MNILLGKGYVDNDSFPNLLCEELAKKNIHVNRLTEKYNQKGILGYVSENDVDVLILQEYVEALIPVVPEYINRLLEEKHNLNVVFIVSDKHKTDKQYLNQLYRNKTYNVLFEEDAEVSAIVELVIKQREPKEAKLYFGLTDYNDNEDTAGYGMANQLIDSIVDYLVSSYDETELNERYNNLILKYSDKENRNIAEKLPLEITKMLEDNPNFKTFTQKVVVAAPANPILKQKPDRSDRSETSFNNVVVNEVKIVKEYVSVVKSVFKEVIAVYSPLSHGSSIIASNIAMAIAQNSNFRVCLIDLNPLKPSFKKIFKTEFSYSVINVLNEIERGSLSNEKLESFMNTCKDQKNLDILFGVYDINAYYTFAANGNFPRYINMLIEKCKLIYDYVIIDTHSYYDMIPTNQALHKADKVIVPVYGNEYDVEEVNRYIKNFKKYDDFDTNKFRYVINKYTGDDLTFVELESRIPGEIVGYVSEHKLKNGSLTKDSKILNEFLDVVNSLNIVVKKKKSLFNIFKKKKVTEEA